MKWKPNSSYPYIKYDHFLPLKIQRSLVPNFSVIEQLLGYWVFIKGMYRWRGSLCLSSSDGHHEQGKFLRIESLVPNVSVIEPNVFSFITVW